MMSRRLACFVVLLSILSFTTCRISEERIEQQPEHSFSQYTIQQFLDVTDYSGASFSHENSRILVSSDESGIINAWAIPTDGSEPVQLTDSTTDAIEVYDWFPNDDRFLYHADQGGNELDHIYVREEEGSVVDLTPGENLKASFLGWAIDDESFFVTSNERDDRYFDLYEYQSDGYEREMIYQDDTGLDIAAISDDKRYIAFNKPRTTYDSDVWIYDRDEDELRNLTAHEGDVANTAEDFGPDSKTLYFTTDDGSEFAHLVRMDLETGEKETIVQPEWDVLYAAFSKHGKYLVVGVNRDARTVIELYDGATLEPVRLTDVPDGTLSGVEISDDETMMAFYADRGTSPETLYAYDIEDGRSQRLVSGLPPEIDSRDLVDGKVVRFDSWDGLEVPGILYEPHQASAEEPVPALVWVHGGPGGQSRLGYRGLLQYLVNHGYAIYAINNRGSSGYGKTFYKADDRKHGDADLDDCVASKQMLIDTGWIDPDRIGIIGGSYGGYMVLAALAFRPEEFDVGVDIFGISNWVRTMESIPPWWESFREALITEIGDPVEDREMLEAKSPLFHAENIVRPLMVLQGANDPRVIKPESDDIVEAVRKNEVPVEYVVFEDEGHGFKKKENREEAYRKILEFLDTHLKYQAARPMTEPAN